MKDLKNSNKIEITRRWGEKETQKGGNNAFSNKLDFKCQFQVSTSPFGLQKMTMDMGSLMSKCFGMCTKPCFQKILFPLLGADEPILSLDIDIDDDSVRKYLNQLKF
jgi:hypothetical protein